MPTLWGRVFEAALLGGESGVTTITAGLKTCGRDSGLFIRDCQCPDCDSIREEFDALHLAKARVWRSNRSDEEKDATLRGIEAHIERYKQWL
jgi:hypothetical protein